VQRFEQAAAAAAEIMVEQRVALEVQAAAVMAAEMVCQLLRRRALQIQVRAVVGVRGNLVLEIRRVQTVVLVS
jgi:hypothetical protein